MNQPTTVLQTAREKRQPLGFSLGTYVRCLDWILLGATIALSVYGLLMLYSATHSDTSSSLYYVRSQSVGLLLGFVFMVILSVIDYQVFAPRQIYIYGFTLLLPHLDARHRYVGGEQGGVGADRWIQLPFFRLQTSELANAAAVILSLGAFWRRGLQLRHRFRFVVLCVVYVLIPVGFVFLQPDLGTALVFFAISPRSCWWCGASGCRIWVFWQAPPCGGGVHPSHPPRLLRGPLAQGVSAAAPDPVPGPESDPRAWAIS
jgi:cell division protein FtsW (lipid II flippase)